MVMGEKIDAGHVLGHYLPAIESKDDPARLFAKCVIGGVSMYDDFLNWYWSKGSFSSVVQSDPLFYYRGFNWNVTQNLSIERIIKSGLTKKCIRDEMHINYWAENNDYDASVKLRGQVTELLIGPDCGTSND